MGLSIAAVGDVSFHGLGSPGAGESVFAEVGPYLSRADLAIANLESPLVSGGRAIPGKCTLRGSPEWAGALRAAGIDLVSLANNHVMDYGPAGLLETMNALSEAGVRFVGAGIDRAQAYAPLVLDVRGARIACLARTAVHVTAPTLAGERAPGVAWLDAAETTAAVARCRRDADLVVVLVHWGIEEYRRPSPSQRAIARRLVDAGADLVLGHHPHVTQGIERIGTAVVAYSLGNFVFGEFDWELPREDGSVMTLSCRLSSENRRGLLLELHRASDGPPALQLRPTRIDGTVVRLDLDPQRSRELERLSARLIRPAYRLRWWLYALRREWALRVKPQLMSPLRTPRALLKLRPRHLRQLLGSFLRSGRIVVERSANPYE